MTTDLRFPIGQFEPQPYSVSTRNKWLLDLETLPTQMEIAVTNLDEAQLRTPYRPGGWTVHQLVHHVADSHMNAYMRFKLALTESAPVIKAYDEKKWALLADVDKLPINISLTLLHALHLRWTALIASIEGKDWERIIIHPETGRKISLWELLGTYSWHGRHHLAHITSFREREGW